MYFVVAPTYTKSIGDCRGGKSPAENAGFTQYDDRNCQERCSNSPTCTGFTLPLEGNWCQTKTSVGAIGDGSSPYECFMKSPGTY